jgi:hypothetical protein
MAKIRKLPKDLRHTVDANIGRNIDTQSHVKFYHVQQKRMLELKATTWKEWPFADGYYKQRKWLSVNWGWSVPPSI